MREIAQQTGVKRSKVLRAAFATLVLAVAACGSETPDSGAIDAALTTDGALQAGGPGRAQTSELQARAQPQNTSSSAVAPVIADLDTSGWLLPPPFYAAGDEPYWRLDIADGWYVFRRSGLPEIEAPMVAPTRNGTAEVFESAPLSITVRKGACETLGGDGGVARVLVQFDGADYSGCGFAGENTVGDAAVSAAVSEALGAVDACLARLGEPALVTGIYAREGGRTALGLRTHIGSLFECAVESDDRTIAFLDPIEPGSANAWMTSRMRFLRVGASAEAACESAEEIRGADGLLGWQLPDSCRF